MRALASFGKKTYNSKSVQNNIRKIKQKNCKAQQNFFELQDPKNNNNNNQAKIDNWVAGFNTHTNKKVIAMDW